MLNCCGGSYNLWKPVVFLDTLLWIASYFLSTVVREKPQMDVPSFRFDLSISFHLVGFVTSVKQITNTGRALPRLMSRPNKIFIIWGNKSKCGLEIKYPCSGENNSGRQPNATKGKSRQKNPSFKLNIHIFIFIQ